MGKPGPLPPHTIWMELSSIWRVMRKGEAEKFRIKFHPRSDTHNSTHTSCVPLSKSPLSPSFFVCQMTLISVCFTEMPWGFGEVVSLKCLAWSRQWTHMACWKQISELHAGGTRVKNEDSSMFGNSRVKFSDVIWLFCHNSPLTFHSCSAWVYNQKWHTWKLNGDTSEARILVRWHEARPGPVTALCCAGVEGSQRTKVWLRWTQYK